jgi:hypothetical protein
MTFRIAAARASAAAMLMLGFLLAASGAQAQSRPPPDPDRIREILASLRGRSTSVLGLMGYNMTPDGSTNAVEVNRTGTTSEGEGQPSLLLGQFGFGYTVSESFPLFLENYIGYARYDPRALFSGEGARRLPLRWNNVTATLGVGYDFALTDTLFLRPILNVGAGYAASDASLFGSFLEWRTGVDISPLTDRHMNVWSYGGALMLAYYDYRPQRDIEVELRYTRLHLETFGDTAAAFQGSANAETIGIWGRYRWPTGREAFGRDIRWVIDGSASYYLGDQREAVGFAWSAKIGGGIEFDVGRHEIGAMGLNLNRIRLIARYFFGDQGVTGTSFGIGMSF